MRRGRVSAAKATARCGSARNVTSRWIGASHGVPEAQREIPERGRGRPDQGVRLQEPHAGAAADQDHAQHGRGRSRAGRQVVGGGVEATRNLRTLTMHNLSILFALAAVTLAAADFPQAEISNGPIRAKLYLPDAPQGYYRATRFDWSGQISTLEFQGHNYFGQWFDHYDPNGRDCILGPVEEFLTNG